jgi:hypothetical protein
MQRPDRVNDILAAGGRCVSGAASQPVESGSLLAVMDGSENDNPLKSGKCMSGKAFIFNHFSPAIFA